MAALLADLEPGLISEKVSWERFLEISEGTDLKPSASALVLDVERG